MHWTQKEELWVKLDNLTSETYRENKVRKLEFLLADALYQHNGKSPHWVD